jgi:2-C-methyl-D-erythritol 2,4-cyclodiphosphate synthase
MFPFRIGMGYDVHKLEQGLPFMLGGIRVEHHSGAVGHSDADVLLHAICDALLGAAGLRDIGFHFPDNNLAYKGIDSRKLLAETCRKIWEKGWVIGNVDCTIALQSPKISGYIKDMQSEIEKITQTASGSVSVKATTTEKLGFTGREEGVAAWAVALIHKQD